MSRGLASYAIFHSNLAEYSLSRGLALYATFHSNSRSENAESLPDEVLSQGFISFAVVTSAERYLAAVEPNSTWLCILEHPWLTFRVMDRVTESVAGNLPFIFVCRLSC